MNATEILGGHTLIDLTSHTPIPLRYYWNQENEGNSPNPVTEEPLWVEVVRHKVEIPGSKPFVSRHPPHDRDSPPNDSSSRTPGECCRRCGEGLGTWNGR